VGLPSNDPSYPPGKTTILKDVAGIMEKNGLATLYLNCDIEENLSQLDTSSLTKLSTLFQKSQLIFIDEAQNLSNPGLTLKIIHDNLPNIKIVATGSSSFKLKNSVSDALTGRYFDFLLYPLSFREAASSLTLSNNEAIKKSQFDAILSSILTYGLYPEVYLEPINGQKEALLLKITESYLFKDVFSFQKVRRSQVLVNLAKALAYQIGSPISENELSKRLGIDRKTVMKYLDILEQTYVIFRVYPYSKNPQREIGRSYKVYFVDLGVRNALIQNFQPLEIRPDVGPLWENFFISERVKLVANKIINVQFNYWKTYDGAKVDLIEHQSGQEMRAFKCKYSQSPLSKGAYSFTKRYETNISLISKDNYQDYTG